MSDDGPSVPPDRAFAVAGRVDKRVHAALAEARRIRDHWQASLGAAEQAAALAAARDLQRRWDEAHAALREEALALAAALATRLGVEAAEQKLTALLAAVAPSPPGAPVTALVSPADAGQARAQLDGVVAWEVDATLAAGQVRVHDPHGLLGRRVAAMVAALVQGA